MFETSDTFSASQKYSSFPGDVGALHSAEQRPTCISMRYITQAKVGLFDPLLTDDYYMFCESDSQSM